MDLTRREDDDRAQEYKEQSAYTHTVGTRATQCTTAVCEWRGKFHTFRNILFRATSMILMEEDDKYHNVHPYKDRQYDLIKKHFTNGSPEPNVHKTVFAFRFMSLTTRTMSSLSFKLLDRI